MKSAIIAFALGLSTVLSLLPAGASAATFSFDAVVTEAPVPPNARTSFPPLGATGTINITIDGPLDQRLDETGPIFFNSFADVPGFIQTLFRVRKTMAVSVTQTAAFFSNFSKVRLDVPSTFDGFRTDLNSVVVTFATPLPVAPVTVGDLVDAISLPGAQVVASLDKQNSETFEFFFTELSSQPAPIPLPAAGWLLLGGIGLLGFGAQRSR
ncbi:MAG: hypothetical protein AAF919_09845 [Pseudomonadota bacterium]